MKNSCFIISPIGETGTQTREDADDLRDVIIKPALDIFDFDVKRGDHRSEAGQIDVDVIKAVQESDLCIVDLSQPNPNVYYELGRRDETGKPVILLKSKNSPDLPVDIATRRYIEYDLDSRHGIRDAIQQIRNFVEPIVEKGFEHSGSSTTLSDLGDVMRRLERKIDRLSDKLGSAPASVSLGAAPVGDGEDDLTPSEMLKLALNQNNIPLAEQAMQRLQFTMDRMKWLDNVVEVVAARGSVKAGTILIESVSEFFDNTESLPAKVEYMAYLVSYLNKQDKEMENCELVESMARTLLDECGDDEEDDAQRCRIHNQLNRLYYGVYSTTGEDEWLQKAIQHLKEALKYKEGNYLYYNLSMCERKAGDLESAREHILRCLELDGDEVDTDHLEMACMILYQLEDPSFSDMIALLEQAAPRKAQLLRINLKKL